MQVFVAKLDFGSRSRSSHCGQLCQHVAVGRAQAWGRGSLCLPVLALDLFCSVTSNKSHRVSSPIKFHAYEVRDNYLPLMAFMSIKGGNECECVFHVWMWVNLCYYNKTQLLRILRQLFLSSTWGLILLNAKYYKHFRWKFSYNGLYTLLIF